MEDRRSKLFFATKAEFIAKLADGTIAPRHTCYVKETHEIWTHGEFFGMSDEIKGIIDDLDAQAFFGKVSDGSTIAAAAGKNSTLVIKGAGSTTVNVGEYGVTVTSKADVATGTNNGQVRIDGQDVSVKGLASAAYTDTSAYATAAQGTKADNAVPKTRKVNGHALTADVTVTKADVGLSNVTNESKATMFTSPNFTGIPLAPTAPSGTSTTQIATTEYVQSEIDKKIAASDAMIYKGTIGTKGTVTALPDTTAKTGWSYKVVTAGTYAGAVCEIGDMIVCLTDGSSSTPATWTVVQANIDGAVTGPASAVSGRIATFNGATGKVIKDSGYTIGKSVPSNALFTDTTYTFASGSDGSFSYTPKNGSATKVSIGKPATAGTADKTSQTIVIKLNGGNTEGSNMFSFNGSSAKTINITPSSIGAAAASHTQASNTISKMTGYSKPSETSAISANDSLNVAIGKLEAMFEWGEYE